MIVLTTPTGQIGRQVLARLLTTDEQLRVVVRHPARLGPEVRERVQVVSGSRLQPDVLTRAFAGADSVLWVVPPDLRAEDVTEYYLRSTRPACASFTEHGVARVVGVTSLGHGWPKQAGNLSAAMAMDELIASTGVGYRALAAPFLMENLLGQVRTLSADGTFAMTNAADRPLRTVATADIAAAATSLLLDDSWTGQHVVPVVGPDHLTPEGMAETMSGVLQRPVRYQHVSDQDFTDRMLGHGLSRACVQGLVAMTTAQSEGIYEAALTAPAAATRATPARSRTGFGQWCQDVLRPAVLGSSAGGAVAAAG